MPAVASPDASCQVLDPRPVEEDERLPIELASFTDRFINSLTAKTQPTPPSIDRLSALFQDFYVKSSAHITTHVSTLSTRQYRGHATSSAQATRKSSHPLRVSSSPSSISSDGSRPSTARSASEQQLLSPVEIAERRKARKQLEEKSTTLEEAVERRACEKIYSRIWRHRSTDDEERDEKLRSRTAALAVVGIGLQDLGIDMNDDALGTKQQDIKNKLEGARASLAKMSDERWPLAKLKHLEAAHKSIVETLSHFRSSSSSADEILPALIYTLITSPPQGINVISNVLFIQRFRSIDKIDGEAAYCLTNLEAAISFLDTVDLASLRESELSNQAITQPRSEAAPLPVKPNDNVLKAQVKSDPSRPTLDSVNILGDTKAVDLRRPAGPILTHSHQRRLSSLLQPPSQALGAASDVVMSTADQGIKTIGSSLESSYKFLFGRLKERQINGAGTTEGGEIIVPKTLDEARQLVSDTPPLEDDTASLASSSAPEPLNLQAQIPISQENLQINNQARPSRDRSADSSKSGGSGHLPGFASGLELRTETSSQRSVESKRAEVGAQNNATSTVDSMISLGSSLNPLSRLSGINMIRPFGRRGIPPPNDRPQSSLPRTFDGEFGDVTDLTTAFPELSAALPLSDMKIDPPIKRFMALENPGDLRISEVLELLRDYRRLAKALEKSGAFC
ncbi:MAG: hypothetical protein M1814_000232 [Vezdaea aestivalis]|nr:MAG: hypothetical protein M1814_000232 [Vezdaea aestivalis]